MDEQRTKAPTIQLELSVESVATLLTWHRQMCMAMEGKADLPEEQFMKAAKEFSDEVSKSTPSMVIHHQIFQIMKDRLNEMG